MKIVSAMTEILVVIVVILLERLQAQYSLMELVAVEFVRLEIKSKLQEEYY